MPSRLHFHLDAAANDSRARAATFRTLHNEVQTPLFMPVGTQATVKAQLTRTLEEAGTQILLANTYHLLLRPGAEVFRRTGGIHGFMSWDRSVLTDSGGFQIFSLPHSRSMSEAGRGLPKLSRRADNSAQPGAEHRNADSDRERHHDGARSMHRFDRG